MHLDWPPESPADSGEEYHKYAEFYDLFFNELADDAEFYLPWATSQGLTSLSTVLEAGVGTGRLAEKFLQAGYRVIGLDRSAEMLEQARHRLAGTFQPAERCQLIQGDLRTMNLPEKVDLVVAPYGMVAHLQSDDDRRAAFRSVHEQLVSGGWFVFDDMPAWLCAPGDSTQLEVWKTAEDPRTGQPVRIMTNRIEAAEAPLSVRYDIIDWLEGTTVARRVMIRVIFRNIALADELKLLGEAGFAEIEIRGGFDGRAFDAENLSANSRLILCCRRKQ